ncbi:hypothetical protein BUALT_Bualt03G0134700 [Buddleja alternifolia]|uniref:CBS domain-containing protein n=1 Tax=Buddleja alternifolia TaxID=168488 RepID=A0AAV6XXR1_9LAMI|nr:hypothetical protein BUALT_Bualt03G0134700 [Buddleja alternifolia]
MAVRLLCYEVADLCLGKPPLRSLSASATVADALAALKSSDDNYISVWSCDHSSKRNNNNNNNQECLCVGKLCMVDIICYLCRDENLMSPSLALNSPLSVLLSNVKALVRHVEPSSSLLEAIDLILQGAQNLVVPIKSNITINSKRKQLQKSSSITPTIHNGQEFCWLTQEDVIRFLLSSIGLFSPIPTLSIDALGIITHEFAFVDYHSPASSAIGLISRALTDQTSVAVVDEGGILIGEISPFTLSCCDETVGPAIMTLSAGDLMAYIDCGGPPEDMVRVVEERLKERNLEGMLEELYNVNSNSSSEDEELLSPTTTLSRPGRYSRSTSSSARMVRRAEAIVCHPWSSLVAVMIQAIAHRLNYVWVIEEDCSLVGIVTFANMLEVFRENLECMV